MKKLSLLMMLAFISLSFALPQSAFASLSPVHTELSVSPASKGLTKKEKRKRLRQLRKKYRKEMRGMSKAEKQAFLADQLAKPSQTQEIPRKELFIIALVLLVIGWILAGFLGSWVGFIGSILLVVWLILFLVDYL